MRKLITSVFALLCIASNLHAESPTFTLSQVKAGGSLHWLEHGSHHFPSPYGHIKDDPKEKDISIGLAWSAKIDDEADKILSASFYWEIQRSELKRSTYEIAAKKREGDTIVFELIEPGSKETLLVSPEVKLIKMIRGDASTIAKHAQKIDLSELINRLEEPADSKDDKDSSN